MFKTRQLLVALPFFNEVFFHVTHKYQINPSNLEEQLANIPANARLFRRANNSFCILKDRQVIGVMRPMLCSGMPRSMPSSGWSVKDYAAMALNTKGAVLLVVTDKKLLMVVLSKNGTPLISPKVFTAYPNKDTVIDNLPWDAPFYQQLFGYWQEHHLILSQCDTWWVCNISTYLWTYILRIKKTYYDTESNIAEYNLYDKNFIKKTPHTFKIHLVHNRVTQYIDYNLAVQEMTNGVIELSM